MRGRIVQGLAVALLVALGAAHGPTNSSAASNPKFGPNQAPQATAAQHNARPYQVGTASWYGDYFEGRPTASGEPFNMYDMTAAHLILVWEVRDDPNLLWHAQRAKEVGRNPRIVSYAASFGPSASYYAWEAAGRPVHGVGSRPGP